MDKDTMAGTIKEAAGRVERGAGRLAGDSDTEIRGGVRELSGAAQRAYGDAKDDVREFVGDVTGTSSIAPLLAAAAAGLVLGLFLNRR